jgi:hypothetical protein
MVHLARVIAVGVPHITQANESTRNNFIPSCPSPIWQTWTGWPRNTL